MKSWSLSKVIVENIGGIRGRREYEFREGVNYIRGPNASYKTSLVRGIVWCLTGAWGLTGDYRLKVGDRAELNVLLNRGANRGFVELYFTKEGRELVIMRELVREDRGVSSKRCSISEVAQGRVEKLVEDDPEGLRSILEEELGVRNLHQAFYTLLNDENDVLLVSLRDGSELMKYVIVSSGVEAFDLAVGGIEKLRREFASDYERCLEEVERRMSEKGEYDALAKDVERYKSDLRRVKEELANFERRKTELAEEVARLGKVEADLRNLEQEARTREARLEEFEFSIVRTERELRRQAEELECSRGELGRKEELLRALEDKKAILEREHGEVSRLILQLKTELLPLEKELSKHKRSIEVYKRLAEVRRKLGEVRAQLESHNVRLGELDSRLRGLESVLDAKFEALSTKRGLLGAFDYLAEWIKGSADVCPLCDRSWTAELQKEAIRRLEPKEAELRKEVIDLDAEVTALRAEVRRLREERDEEKEEVIELGGKEKVYADERRTLEDLVPPETLDNLERIVFELEERKGDVEISLAARKEKCAELEENLRSLTQTVLKLRDEVAKLRESIVRGEGAVETMGEHLEGLKMDKKRLRREVEELKGRISKLEATYDRKMHEELRGKLESIREEESRKRGEQNRIASELEKKQKRLREVETSAKEYEEYSKKAETYRKARDVTEIVLKTVKKTSRDLRENVRGKINENILALLGELGFGEYDVVELREDYNFRIVRGGVPLDLSTVSKGELNALGIAIKLAIASFGENLPPLICYDDCLYLDSDRREKLLGRLGALGVTTVIVTERAGRELTVA